MPVFSPPLWRGRVLPFTVQSRDHLATITDIYVPSFLRPVRGTLAPRLLLSIPRHSMPAFILSIPPFDVIRLFMFFFSFIFFTHAWVCIVLGKGCQPVSRQPLPSIFFEFWCKDRHKKTSLKFRDSFGNDGTISVLKRYSQMILL